jgi:ABC-type transport system involved in cytochrome c biogenesis permease subunit
MKDKSKSVIILTIAILISAILGIGSTRMSGHEAAIFPFLEFVFLLMYAISLIVISIKNYKRDKKTTGKIVFISSLLGVVAGGLIYTCIDYYL